MDWNELKPIDQFDIWVVHGMLIGQAVFVAIWGRLPWWKEWVGRALMTKAVSLLVLIAVAIVMFWLLIVTDREWRYTAHLLLATHLFVLVGIWSQVIAILHEKHVAERGDRRVGGTTQRSDGPTGGGTRV